MLRKIKVLKNIKINWKSILRKAGKVLNVCWKVALVFVGLFIIVLTVAAAHRYYEMHLGKVAHEYDRHLTDRIWVHQFNGNTVRVYDSQIGKYVTPRLRWVSDIPKNDSLAVFCNRRDKRGFLNIYTGKIVLEGKYRYAWVFSEGLAAVVESDGKLGFIDKTGKYVIAPTLDFMSSNNYVFKHGTCYITDLSGNYGILKRDGSVALPIEYEDIEYVPDVDMFIVGKDNVKGVVKNGSFEWVFPLEYDDIFWDELMSENSFALYKDFRLQRVSADGNILDPFVISDTAPLKYRIDRVTTNDGDDDNDNDDDNYEYKISDELIVFWVRGLQGVMDKHSGKVIIPAQYGPIELISPTIIQCMLSPYEPRGCVLYDLKGNIIQ